MKIVLKIVALLFVAVAALLIYAIIAAVTSDEGARVGVAIGFGVGALVLGFLAMKMWTWRGSASAA